MGKEETEAHTWGCSDLLEEGDGAVREWPGGHCPGRCELPPKNSGQGSDTKKQRLGILSVS